MDVPYILRVFVSVLFLSDFVLINCVAAVPSCPVRAVPVPAPEVEGGHKCVCQRNYYGENCRFKAREKSIDAEAQWLTSNSAIVTWHGQYGENFHLSVRRIIYHDNGTIIPSKWFQGKVASTSVELYGNVPTRAMLKTGTPAKMTAVLHFTQVANYEVYLSKITSTREVNGSVSIFFDSENILVLDEHNKKKNNATIKCAWFECPGQFFHVTSIMEDFGKPCFVHGAIVAVPVTIFGILLIGTLIYVVVRQCKRMKSQKRNITKSVIGHGAELSDNENLGQNNNDNETLKSVIIEMPENESCISCAGNEDFKSFVVTIDDIEAVKPPSLHWTDEELTLSQSSGPSLTTVTSLSTLSISSLSEGEIVLPMAHALED